MALSAAVKHNKTIRCLDLNIPVRISAGNLHPLHRSNRVYFKYQANDPDFSRLSQEIMQSCTRNTESAQQTSNKKIAAPIHSSTVARMIKETETAKAEKTERQTRRRRDLISAADGCVKLIDELLTPDVASSNKDVLRDVREQGKAVLSQITEVQLEPLHADEKGVQSFSCPRTEIRIK